MERVYRRIGHPNVTLVQGYFSESLPLMHLASLRPALLVDVDVDLYASARDALTWLFRSNLVIPGTIVHYDDWTNLNASDELWGEMRAHREITEEFNVKWRLVGDRDAPSRRHWLRNEYQVVSIGDTRPVVGRPYVGR